MAVFRAFGLLPLAFVAQAVSKPPACWVESQPQKSQIARGKVQGTGGSAAPKLPQKNYRAEGPGIGVRGVCFPPVGSPQHGLVPDPRTGGHPRNRILYGCLQ